MNSNPFKDKALSKLLRVNLFVMAADLLILLFKRSSLPEKVPLFYSRPWGEEQLAERNFLFLIPLSSLLIFALNWLISRILLKRGEIFLAILNNSFSLLFSLLGAITLYKIIFLIT